MRFGFVRGALCAAGCAALAVPVLVSQSYKANLQPDDPAIRYWTAPAGDEVSKALADPITHNGEPHRPGTRTHLEAVLARLGIGADSQMLVFSKTSVQAPRVSPGRPRAIYFSDSVAVAYVPGSPSLEVAVVDPALGPVFYALSVDTAGAPALARNPSCLRCHHGPNTSGVPGLYVGSVLPGPTGLPLRDDSAVITDHRSPFAERWGGWYVTARRGEQPDRANAVALDPAEPSTLVRDTRQNLSTLAGRVDLADYPASTSDIVALMTFEHQTQAINLLTRVAWQARIWQAASPGADVAGSPVDADIEELVKYLLFEGEAPLTEPVEGASTFAASFAQRGPKDGRGRSLREFDLRTRLFRYPLSYMVYSAAFDALPPVARDRVYRRLYEVLRGLDASPPFKHLTPDDRRAIVEILRDTKRNLPSYWRVDGQ